MHQNIFSDISRISNVLTDNALRRGNSSYPERLQFLIIRHWKDSLFPIKSSSIQTDSSPIGLSEMSSFFKLNLLSFAANVCIDSDVKPAFDMSRYERVDGMSGHIKSISFDVFLQPVKLNSSNLEMLI